MLTIELTKDQIREKLNPRFHIEERIHSPNSMVIMKHYEKAIKLATFRTGIDVRKPFDWVFKEGTGTETVIISQADEHLFD